MKPIKFSFLFFIIVACFSLKSYSQLNDSINYYSELIKDPNNNNDLADAYKFFQKRKEEYSEKRLIENEIYATIYIGDIQRKLGYIERSEKLYLECLKLLDAVEFNDWNIKSKVSIINSLGIIYRNKKDYNEALKIYNDGLELATKRDDVNTLINNIGYMYLKKKELKTALEYFDLAYKKSLKENNPKDIARSLDNIGVTKSKMKIEGAEKDLIEALHIRENEKYIPGIIHSNESLARHYSSVGDSSKTLLYSNKVRSLALETNNLEQILSAYRLKIEIGDKSFTDEYINIRDSIDIIKDKDRSNFNYYVYQNDKKEKQIQAKTLENAKQRSRNLIYLLFGITVLLISTFLYFILKSRHKKEKQQQVYVTESRISKKVHDEVANDVFQVMTKLQSETNSNEHLIDDIEQIYNKTRDISKEHSLVDLKEDFKTILNDLVLSYTTTNTNLIVKGIEDVNWKTISKLKRVTIYKVLQELLINMKKHSKASVVVFTYATDHKKTIINYNDNGIGCELKKGTGLQNVENRIASINGTITFESDINKGFKAKLVV